MRAARIRRLRFIRAALVGTAFAAPARAQDAIGVVAGSAPGDAFGVWASPFGGDVDGDGVPDFATYAYAGWINANGPPPYLAAVSGRTRKILWRTAVNFDSTADFDLAATPGDLNGDGIPDVATIERSGSTSQLLRVRSGVDGSIVRALGSFGFENLPGVRAIGDVDGDGLRDVAMSRWNEQRILAVSTSTGATVWHLTRQQNFMDLSDVGDVDGDAISDVAVGYGDHVTIHSGKDGSRLRYFDKSTYRGACNVGLGVDGLGDVDGDGIPDLVTSGSDCPSYDIWIGALSGASGKALWTYRVNGLTDPLGRRVRSVGDVDGDGTPDVLVGGIDNGVARSVRLLSGATGTLIERYAAPQSRLYQQGWGYALAGCGDLDGDGLAEFCIGDFGYATVDQLGAGAIIVYDRRAPDPAAGVNATIVDVHGNGAYTTIQDAINAAADGDLILVRPGTYDGFTLSKRVVIGTTSLPICIDSDVQLVAVAAGTEPAGLRDVFVEGPLDFSGATLSILDCSGEVVLDGVRCGLDYLSTAHFDVERSPNVALESCAAAIQTGLTVIDSSVRAGDFACVGPGYLPAGQPAIVATRSTLVMARPAVVGAIGTRGICNYPYGGWQPAGNGGPAILADGSTLTILGTPSDLIQGGDGGAAPSPCSAYPGAGGDGIDLANGADVTISRVTLAGGNGYPLGSDWAGSGTFNRFDQLPHLKLSPTLALGATTTLALDSVETGNVILFASTVGGFQKLRSFFGPPLSVLPGPGFSIVATGATDAAGQWTVSGMVPVDLSLVGGVVELQAAVFANSGTLYLTNALGRILGL